MRVWASVRVSAPVGGLAWEQAWQEHVRQVLPALSSAAHRGHREPKPAWLTDIQQRDRIFFSWCVLWFYGSGKISLTPPRTHFIISIYKYILIFVFYFTYTKNIQKIPLDHKSQPHQSRPVSHDQHERTADQTATLPRKLLPPKDQPTLQHPAPITTVAPPPETKPPAAAGLQAVLSRGTTQTADAQPRLFSAPYS